MKNKFRVMTILLSLTTSLVIFYLYNLSHNKTNQIYIDQTKRSAIRLKQDFLKDTVNNVIYEIDSLRKNKYDYYKELTDDKLEDFKHILDSHEEDFIDLFKNDFSKESNNGMWAAVLWDNETGVIHFSSAELRNIQSIHEDIKHISGEYVSLNKDNISALFGIKNSFIEDSVKEEIGDLIRSYKFSNDSYIWVNEIIDYDGGKDYAIRRIHPNLRDTEGSYLSTETADIKGNLPYLIELEGINKRGEIFFTYNFKKLNSDKISEKITYAKLYKVYDWVIAMGVHIDDIAAYTDQVNNEISTLSKDTIFVLLKYILLTFGVGVLIIYIVEKKYIKTSTYNLQKEVNLDSLTGANSRRFGENVLAKSMNKFKNTHEGPAIMMLDFDDFKGINDKYGHKAGDTVLKEIVKKISQVIRSSDILVRWGGDEFVGIFPGLKEEYALEFGDKLLDEISSLKVDLGNEIISVTASIGLSYFKEDDKDYLDALNRADNALYHSKSQGKNKTNKL